MDTTEQAWRCPVCATLHETRPVKCRQCGRQVVRAAHPPISKPSKIKTYAPVIVVVVLVSLAIASLISFFSYQANLKAAKLADQKAWEERIGRLDKINKAALDDLKETNPNALKEIKADPNYHRNTLHKLRSELMNFKDSESFTTYGFSARGPHNTWLTQVKALANVPDHDIALAAGELQSLGFEYMSSRGKETKGTRIFKGFVDEDMAKVNRK